MDAPLHLLPQWLMPDDQPGDWYQWTLVASGHAKPGAVHRERHFVMERRIEQAA